MNDGADEWHGGLYNKSGRSMRSRWLLAA